MTRHRCEGPTIAAALEEAARRYGPGVRVVATRRVRRGGIAGFFATERIEVEVETASGARRGPARAVGSRRASGRDRAARGASDASPSDASPSDANSSERSGESHRAGSAPTVATRMPGSRRPGAAVPATGRAAPAVARPGVESKEVTLAERVLEAELAADTGTERLAVRRTSATRRSPAVGQAAAGPGPTLPGPRAGEVHFADHLAAALGGGLGEGIGESGGAPVGSIEESRTEEGRREVETSLRTGPLGTGPLGTGEEAGAHRGIGSVCGPGRIGTPRPNGRRPASGIDGALASLGVPAWLRAEVAVRGRGLASLAEALAERPLGRLPDAPGAIVAVVGPPADVVDAAERIAGEYGLGARAVSVVEGLAGRVRGCAPSRCVQASEVREAAERWRAGRRPKVVALPVRLGATGAAGGLRSLVDLDPVSTLAVVSATAKLEDVAAWLCGLGGADGVLVVDAAASVTPASVLALDVPIVRLDGEPATAERWLDLLVARLALTPQARHAVTV